MRYLKIFLLLLLLSAWGCANITGTRNTEPQAAVPTSFYYDFNDIRVPSEMEIQPKKSAIAPVVDGKSGVMKFRGRVEPVSLFDFFYNTMPKDGWTLLTYQKYQRYLLVFSKDNRMTVITIEEGLYYTWLEIWVSPCVPEGFQIHSGGATGGYAPAGTSYPGSGMSYPSSGSSFEDRTLTQ
jgi:hypothetical protein